MEQTTKFCVHKSIVHRPDWPIHDDKLQNTVDDETQASQYQDFHTDQVQPIIDCNRFSKYERLLLWHSLKQPSSQRKLDTLRLILPLSS